jgi:3-deoxy-manno-octulosonate cytidylyltransferase (CMP-KDO synthetase)
MKILIPSRLASTRVPQKALADIGGKVMIRRVVERALLTGLPVIVCTDSQLIKDAVSDIVNVVITDSHIENGTSRIAEVCKDLPLSEKIIDVQGDDPFVDPDTILDVASKMENHEFGCFLPYSISKDPIIDSSKKSIVKIIPNFNGDKVVYMSRHQYYHKDIEIRKHSSVIGFINFTLQQFRVLPRSSIEISESIELMRLIEHGHICYTWEMKGVSGISVDTQDDLQLANNKLKVIDN